MHDRIPVVAIGGIQQRILLVRGVKVIIGADFTQFYEAPTSHLELTCSLGDSHGEA